MDAKETGGKRKWQRLMVSIQRFNNQRHLFAIRTSLITCMPILITGALATVVNTLPLPQYQGFMQAVFGSAWVLFGELISQGSLQVFALTICFVSARNIATWYKRYRNWNVPRNMAGTVALACFIIVSLNLDAPGLLYSFTGIQGVFVSMLVAVIATEAFIRLYIRSNVRAVWGDNPNPAFPRSFSSVLPTLIVVASFAALRLLLVALGYRHGLTVLVYQLVGLPFQNMVAGFGSGLAYTFSTNLLWWFGIHGFNALAGEGAHIVNMGMFNTFACLGGAGAIMGWIVAKFLFAKRSRQNKLMRYMLPTALFNVYEPLLFGLPFVLNPLYVVPFLLAPLVNYVLAYLAMAWLIVPAASYGVSAALPIFFNGWASTHSVAAVILQLLLLAVDVAIYLPFVRLADKLSELSQAEAYKNLRSLILLDYDPSRKTVDRDDEIGTAARHIANHMETAITKGEMYLVYQPIVDAHTGVTHSVEALLRWRHDQYGMIDPFVAVSLAEETGSILPLGMWVFEEAVKQRAQWTAQGLPGFHVSVNASPGQLQEPGLHVKMRRLMEKYGVPFSQIQLEITESAALVESKAAKENLNRLSEMGCTIAMDDFGMGHSSLTYLRGEPISTLKIDASLSREVNHNPINRDIIRMILNLCESLRVETIVEFVDNREQLECLKELGAVKIQGFYFSEPLLPESIPDFMGSSELRFGGGVNPPAS